MAESDPKKIRPFAHSPARPDFESEEDPLVELARIVSEDSGFYPSRVDKAKLQPRRSEPVERNANSADLESELLQELESSFAPRSAPVPAASRAVAQPTKPPLPADDADDLLRSIEEQLGEFERRAHTSDSPRPELERTPEPRPETMRREPGRANRPAEIDPAETDAGDHFSKFEPEDNRPQRRDGSQGDRVQPTESRPSLHAVEPRGPTRVHAARGDVRPARGPVGAAGRGKPDELRRAEPVAPRRREAPEAEEPRGAASREGPRRRAARSGFAAGTAPGWGDTEQGGQPSREAGSAPRRAANVDSSRDLREASGDPDEARQPVRQERPRASGGEPDVSHQLEPRYSDPTLGGRWQEADDPEPKRTAHERDVAVAPVYAEVAGTAARRPERRRTGRKVFVTVAAVLAVAAIGGAAAYYMRTTEDVASGPPPVIAAPEGAVKVEAPPAQQAETETVGEAVYNRVAGAAPSQGEQVVEGAEEPEEISRIVLPPPEPEPAPAPAQPAIGLRPAPAPAESSPAGAAVTGSSPANAAAAEENLTVGPRRVRTFVVRPDGTISASDEGAAAASEPAPPPIEQQVASVAAEMTPGDPVRVPTSEVDGTAEIPAEPLTDESFEASAESKATSEPAPAPEPAPEPAAAPVPDAPEPAPPAAAGSSSTGAEANGTAQEDTTASDPEGAASANETPILPELALTETPAATPAPPPGDLASATPNDQATPPAAAAADGFVVQVSSQKSEAQARSAFADLQRRFPSALGSMEPNIQQADLGAKGIFYRVRVGPWPSRAEAIEVCEAMQAEGGSCFVTR